MKAIAITDIAGVKIGQVEDRAAATGVTAIICEGGMAAGVDVRGGGPASRDSRTLDPLAAAEAIHAVLLAGGSAFGLDAAGGAMRSLEERGIGLPVGDVKVPLVCQSDIFDLLEGDGSVRPDAAMGRAACEAAEQGNYRDGRFGAGCGATVGKVLGPGFSTKSGIGSYAVQLGELQVGAIVVVNALGDVVDPATGQVVAGLRTEDGAGFRSTSEALFALYEAQATSAGAGVGAGEDAAAGTEMGAAQAAPAANAGLPTNTTIGAIITNAKLPKAQLCKVASMGHDGMARAIRPVHSSMDGDTLYALSVGDVEAGADVVGALAADVVAGAILSAVRAARDV